MSKGTPSAALQLELVEVVLDKTHNHKGVPYAKGAKIKVTEAQKTWLEARGVVGGKEGMTNG